MKEVRQMPDGPDVPSGPRLQHRMLGMNRLRNYTMCLRNIPCLRSYPHCVVSGRLYLHDFLSVPSKLDSS